MVSAVEQLGFAQDVVEADKGKFPPMAVADTDMKTVNYERSSEIERFVALPLHTLAATHTSICCLFLLGAR
jgi:hypothetical protein